VDVEEVMWCSLDTPAPHPAAPQSGKPKPAVAPAEPKPADAPAEEELSRKLAALERDAQAREQRAFSEGYAKGEAAGKAAEQARLESAAAALARAASEFAEARHRLRRECEQDCVQLSIAIARRVLHRELSVDAEAMLGIVKAAMARLEGRDVDRIRLHPDDASLVLQYLERTSGGKPVQVVGDPGLARGACILETARGSLDASVETQLAEIQRGLVDRIR